MADPRFKRPTRQANFRWDPDHKALIESAARELGMTLTDFVLSAALARAGHPELAPVRQEAMNLRPSA